MPPPPRACLGNRRVDEPGNALSCRFPGAPPTFQVPSMAPEARDDRFMHIEKSARRDRLSVRGRCVAVRGEAGDIHFHGKRFLPPVKGSRPGRSGAGPRNPPPDEGRVEEHGGEKGEDREKIPRTPPHAVPFPIPPSISLALSTIGLNGSFSMKIVNCSLASPGLPSRSRATARLNRACE
jgi:hypothetical protein